MTETTIVQSIRLACSNDDVRLFRNNTGMLQDRNGTYVRYGLCPGSADLIGWKSVTITHDMVGKQFARFVSIEVKSKNAPLRPEQLAWKMAVQGAGGIAGVARSSQEAKEILGVQDKSR
jgi:hypothetical protein